MEKEKNKKCAMSDIVRRFFNKIGRKILQKTCKHEKKLKSWVDYQERYSEEFCPECQLTIYKSID